MSDLLEEEYRIQKKWDKVESLLKYSLKVRKKAGSDVGSSYNDLAEFYGQMGEEKKAIKMRELAWKSGWGRGE